VAYNVKSGAFAATSVKVVGPGPSFTPASMFMTLVAGPNGDAAESPRATVDWNTSFLRRAEYALDQHAPVNRLKKLLHPIVERDASRDAFHALWGQKGWDDRDVDACFAHDAWELLWDSFTKQFEST